ncbi:hypothetical protein NMY22_g8484 [Coprinellus aureogranulatus]|nr:hypothetical protein NMY22_g8484 [Coprinellus aureogranulatus]
MSSRPLHSKRSFGKHHHMHSSLDSPAYDASEEDNDPLTDDSVSAPIARHSPSSGTPPVGVKSSSKTSSGAVNRHTHSHLSHSAIVLSDSDGVDSPTYDGDIESSTTTRAAITPEHTTPLHKPTPLSEMTTTSTASSIPTISKIDTMDNVLESDAVASPTTPSPRSPPSPTFSSASVSHPYEPPVPAIAASSFNPAALTPEDIQAFVRKAIEDGPDGIVELLESTGKIVVKGPDEAGAGEAIQEVMSKSTRKRGYRINPPPKDRPVRIYADGVYDLFHFGHALQLRQAKLAFPDVHLLVGVNSDEQVHQHKARTVMNHAERLEAVRHCRWVDEVVEDAPWVITAEFLEKHQIDYVAHDEEAYPGAGTDDVYKFVKDQGKFLPTRRTPGVSTSELIERMVRGYRNRMFDPKLVKMGREDLKAEGSEYDGLSRFGSRVQSRRTSFGSASGHPMTHSGLMPGGLPGMDGKDAPAEKPKDKPIEESAPA